MSENRLKKHIDNGTTRVNSTLTFTPVFVSDSKGRYLKSHATSDQIKFFCKSGADSDDIKDWFKNNIQKLITKYSRIRIYIWIGTCDFTAKSDHYIKLDTEAAAEKLHQNLKFLRDNYVNDNVQLTFLKVPYYSISIWNKHRGHPTPDDFRSDDNTLNERIDAVNKYIEELNSEINAYSPQFNQDLERSRKPADTSQRYSLNMKLLRDGIHPGKTLSKAWLISVIKVINSECV